MWINNVYILFLFLRVRKLNWWNIDNSFFCHTHTLAPSLCAIISKLENLNFISTMATKLSEEISNFHFCFLSFNLIFKSLKHRLQFRKLIFKFPDDKFRANATTWKQSKVNLCEFCSLSISCLPACLLLFWIFEGELFFEVDAMTEMSLGFRMFSFVQFRLIELNIRMRIFFPLQIIIIKTHTVVSLKLI